MTKLSHLVTTGSVLILTHNPVIVISGIVGCLIPDIDKKLGIEHRTWTHWPLPYLIFLYFGWTQHWVILIGLMVGASLHLLEDSFTIMGIPILWPLVATNRRDGVFGLRFKRRFSFKLFKTGSFFEFVFVGCWVIIIFFYNIGEIAL